MQIAAAGNNAGQRGFAAAGRSQRMKLESLPESNIRRKGASTPRRSS